MAALLPGPLCPATKKAGLGDSSIAGTIRPAKVRLACGNAGLLRTKSCSTTPPDRTSPNSYRDSGKAAFGLLETAPGDAEPSLTVTESCAPAGATTCCEPQEAKRGDKARKTILLVTREITNVL